LRLTYDATVDAFQLELAPGTPVAKTIEWGPGVHVDVDARGRVLGIEVLDASTHFDAASLATLRPPVIALSLVEAADESGLSAGTLRVLLNSGRLVGSKQGRDWTVRLSDLYVLLNSGRLVGSKQGRDWTVRLSDLYTYLESRAPSGRPAKSRKAKRRSGGTGGLVVRETAQSKQRVARRISRKGIGS